MIAHQTARPYNLNLLIKLKDAFHLIRYILPKGNTPPSPCKVKTGAGLFVFSGEWRHQTKESEDHCINETSEEGQIER